MALEYTGITYGKVTIKQDGKNYTIDIRQCNCLCAFIYIRKATPEELAKYGKKAKYIHELYSFYQNEQHIKNILKSNNGKLFWDEVVNIKLNLYYKPCYTLLKHFTKAGYKVTCYYETPKTK